MSMTQVLVGLVSEKELCAPKFDGVTGKVTARGWIRLKVIRPQAAASLDDAAAMFADNADESPDEFEVFVGEGTLGYAKLSNAAVHKGVTVLMRCLSATRTNGFTSIVVDRVAVDTDGKYAGQYVAPNIIDVQRDIVEKRERTYM